MQNQQQPKTRSEWESTGYQNLVRCVPSGTIFARFKIRGKQVRRSSETTNLELAKRKLVELERNELAIDDDSRRGENVVRRQSHATSNRRCPRRALPQVGLIFLQMENRPRALGNETEVKSSDNFFEAFAVFGFAEEIIGSRGVA